MKRLLPHLHLWRRALSDTEVYRYVGLLHRQFLVVNVLLFFSLLGIAHTLRYSFQTVPRVMTHLESLSESLLTHWPADLELSLANGQLTANGLKQDSLAIPYPEDWDDTEGLPQWLAVIDTRPETTTPRSDSLMTLTRSDLWIQTSNSPQSLSWAEALPNTSYSLTRDEALSQAPALLGQIRQALLMLSVPAWFFFSMGRLALRAIELLLFSWAAQTLLWFFNLKVKYWIAYRLGFLLLIPTELCVLLWQVFYTESFWSGIFWWVWLLFLLVVATMLRWYKPNQT